MSINKLEYIRKTLGFSRSELALRVGVDRTTIWGYERNRCRPSDKVKIKIAREFKMTVEEIFFGQDVECCATNDNDPAGTAGSSGPTRARKPAGSRRPL